jgi:hypothetical protein
MNGYGRSFLALPPVVKNLILLNALLLLANWASKSVFGYDLTMVL